MEIFKEEDYGKPISAALIEFLKKHTGTRDRGTVARKTDIGTSIIRDVMFGYRSLTEDNSKGIIALIEIAVLRIDKHLEDTNNIPEVKTIKDELLKMETE